MGLVVVGLLSLATACVPNTTASADNSPPISSGGDGTGDSVDPDFDADYAGMWVLEKDRGDGNLTQHYYYFINSENFRYSTSDLPVRGYFTGTYTYDSSTKEMVLTPTGSTSFDQEIVSTGLYNVDADDCGEYLGAPNWTIDSVSGGTMTVSRQQDTDGDIRDGNCSSGSATESLESSTKTMDEDGMLGDTTSVTISGSSAETDYQNGQILTLIMGNNGDDLVSITLAEIVDGEYSFEAVIPNAAFTAIGDGTNISVAVVLGLDTALPWTTIEDGPPETDAYLTTTDFHIGELETFTIDQTHTLDITEDFAAGSLTEVFK